MRHLLIAALFLGACGSSVTHAASSPPLVTDQQGQAAPPPEVVATSVSTEPAVQAEAPAPVAPAVRPVATLPPLPPPPLPPATPPPNPQTFLQVTVANAPALNCNPPPMATIDCEDPRAYAMVYFAVGERLPFTRVLTDARGRQFYILGPWTPVGLLPVEDAHPI